MDNYYSDDVQPSKPDLQETLEALQAISDDTGLSSTVYYGLSGLTDGEVEQVGTVLSGLAPEYRRKIMQELAEVSEVNFELNYRGLGLVGLKDDDPTVREAAIEVLWDDDSVGLLHRLIGLAQHDPSREVRAAAVSALGRFILLGEYDELPENEMRRAQNATIALLTNPQENIEVRRRALEAIANSSHEIVNGQIIQAYRSDEPQMRVSSIFAMGRTCDSDQWGDTVLRELSSDDAEMQYEAARSAGELELDEAIPVLTQLAIHPDREIKEVAIWSLGEIGGNEAMRVLMNLADDADEEGDEELASAIEEALSNASLVNGDLFSNYDD